MKATHNLIVFLLLSGCSSPVNIKAEKDKLLLSDDIHRNAHLRGDASLLASQLSDTLISVQHGQFSKASKQEIEQRFSKYFSQLKYRKWDNLAPPIIHISDDGTLASITVNKITETKEIHAPDSAYTSTTFAWTALYRKENDHWKMFSITSTRVRN